MDFTPTEEQRALQSAVRDLASSLTPKDTGSGAPAGPQPFDADAWGKLAEMGLLGLAFAEDKGGFGASAIEVTLAAVELGAARVTLPYADAMAAAAALDAANSPLLADVISGEKLVLTAFGESGATWSPAASARTASGSELAGEARGNTDLSSADAIVTTAGTGDDVGVYLVESPTVDGPKVTLDGAPATRLGGREVLDTALALQLDPYTVAPLWPGRHHVAALQARSGIDAGRWSEAEMAAVAARAHGRDATEQDAVDDDRELSA